MDRESRRPAGPTGKPSIAILLGFPENPLPPSPPPTPSEAPNTVDNSNTAPAYVIKSQRAITHMGVHSFLAGPLRSPNRVQNTFANESFIDELAFAAGADPIAFRLAQLSDERLITVLQTVRQMAGWSPRPAASKIGKGRILTGRGVAAVHYEGTSGYNALALTVAVDTKTGKVTVDRAWSAQDCGPAVNPDGMRQQAEGCLMQSISRALQEEVKWRSDGITSTDWITYPVVRFTSMPKSFEFRVISRHDQPVVGAGEVLITNGPAAIANTIFDATGQRLRQIPFTPARVKAALKT
ncbi:MAG: molybdopterin cofactor-binding domain-containing protein [Gaiellaceae bacterium]